MQIWSSKNKQGSVEVIRNQTTELAFDWKIDSEDCKNKPFDWWIKSEDCKKELFDW